jgi:hypothetical protein
MDADGSGRAVVVVVVLMEVVGLVVEVVMEMVWMLMEVVRRWRWW